MKLCNQKTKPKAMRVEIENLKLIKKRVISLLVLSVIISSCSEDNITETAQQLEDIEQVQRAAEIDQIDTVLGDLIVEAYEEEESNFADRSTTLSDIPECLTITVIAEQNYRQLTLDFGTEGCLVRGHVLKGQIVFDYNRNPLAQQITINYNLVDFYFDTKNVIGSRTILRELSNANGNPQFKHYLDVTVIWPNGLQASREGVKIREWVEGVGSGVFSDNVFEITGNWTATFVNGNMHAYDVLTPLRREIGCPFFVSGTFSVVRTNLSGVFNYGDGGCDAQATFTFNNGTEIPIVLN